MDPLILRKPDGTLIPLVNAVPLMGIDRVEQRIELLNTDTFSLSIKSTDPVDIGIGDTLAVYGQLYTLNQDPAATRDGENRFQYDLTFEGPQYHLLRVAFFDTDIYGNALSSVFPLTGNLQFFAEVLFNNMTRVFSGAWGLGDVFVPGESTNTGQPGALVPGSQTVTKTLSFENENCLQVLQRLCAEWGTEFSIEYRPNDAPNRILNIVPAGHNLTDVFKYGQGNALYTLSRRPVQQSNFYTRAYIFGGSKNIPIGYRGFATRLQLPLTGPVGSNPSPSDTYVQDTAAIAKYGLIEGTQVFEDIYPHRTGTVTEVVDQLAFTDTDVDFDPFAYDATEVINGQVRPIFTYQIKGLTPKVSFLTGQLAGYSFDLIKFFTNNFILQLKSYTDENGLVFPSPDPASPFKIAVGDTYVFVDMKMPDEYVAAAEAKLLAAGQAWLAENGAPSVEYSLELDEMYLQKQAGDTGAIPMANPPSFFTMGDSIRLVDTELGIDRMARVTGFTRDGIRPYKYTLTLGDTRKISLLQRILSKQTKISQLVGVGSTPSPGAIAPAVKAELGAVKDTQTTLAHGTKYSLALSTLPSGFRPTSGFNMDRQQMRVEILKAISEGLKKNVGLIGAIGRKRPFG